MYRPLRSLRLLRVLCLHQAASYASPEPNSAPASRRPSVTAAAPCTAPRTAAGVALAVLAGLTLLPSVAQAQSLSTSQVAEIKACRTQAQTQVNAESLRMARLRQAEGGELEVPVSVRALGWRLLRANGNPAGLNEQTLRWWGYHAGQVNAFAAGADTLLVSSALWQSDFSPDEQAAVLAHELSHLAQGHNTLWGCWARVVQSAQLHAQLRQEMEEQAEEQAKGWLAAAGFDPGALPRVRARVGPLAGGAP